MSDTKITEEQAVVIKKVIGAALAHWSVPEFDASAARKRRLSAEMSVLQVFRKNTLSWEDAYTIVSSISDKLERMSKRRSEKVDWFVMLKELRGRIKVADKK